LIVHFDNIVEFEIISKIVPEHVFGGTGRRSLKRRSDSMKCPVCGGKLDVDMKRKHVKCHNCGWNRNLETKIAGQKDKVRARMW